MKQGDEQSSVRLGPRREGYWVNEHKLQAGRRLLLLDDSNGKNSNDKKFKLELLYTHLEMVHSLPEFDAISS